MTDKYQRIRDSIDKMKTSYGNAFPVTFYPGDIEELLDDLEDMAEYNEQLKEIGTKQELEINQLKEGLSKASRTRSKPTSEEVKGVGTTETDKGSEEVK